MKKIRTFFHNTGHCWLAVACLMAVLLSALWTRDEQRISALEAPAHADGAQRLASVTPSPAPVWMAAPAAGALVRSYSEEAVHFPDFQLYALHAGTDYYAEKGDKVFAAFDGTVSLAGEEVRLQKDSFCLRYVGVTPLKIRDGQTVKKGSVLGEATGYVPYEGENILCVTLYQDGKSVDMERFLP